MIDIEAKEYRNIMSSIQNSGNYNNGIELAEQYISIHKEIIRDINDKMLVINSNGAKKSLFNKLYYQLMIITSLEHLIRDLKIKQENMYKKTKNYK